MTILGEKWTGVGEGEEVRIPPGWISPQTSKPRRPDPIPEHRANRGCNRGDQSHLLTAPKKYKDLRSGKLGLLKSIKYQVSCLFNWNPSELFLVFG